MRSHNRWLPSVLVVLATALAALAPPALAEGLPADFVVENAFPATTFVHPVEVLFLPDGRNLVVQSGGTVWTILADGTQYPTPFVNLESEVAAVQDLGLLGAAVDPDFALGPSHRWIYLGYTVDPNGDGIENDADRFVRITRYRFDVADPNVADRASRQVLLGTTWTSGIVTAHTSHSVGALRFASDKTLLVACGEGAHFEIPTDSGGLDPDAFGPDRTDPSEDIGAFRARTLNSLAGKILRIDKETGLGVSSNPYWDGNADAHRSRVWAYGFRNPFRFAIRPGTGSTNPADGNPGVLYVGDVGMLAYEELDIATSAGLNFGWPCFEGAPAQPSYSAVDETEAGNVNVLCSAAPSAENPQGVTAPMIWWHHFTSSMSSLPGWGVGSCVIGGCFYSGSSYPEAYQGRYYVADLISGWIRKIDVDANNNLLGWSEFVTAVSGPVNIVPDPVTGDLYYIAYFLNQVKRIRHLGAVGASEATPPGRQLIALSRPNPFRATTSIQFTLPEPREVSVVVYDVAGRLVRRVAAGAFPEGSSVVEWDGLDERGVRAARGTFFYCVETPKGAVSGKISSAE
jgi:glucose/arabinose dehydrogenase